MTSSIGGRVTASDRVTIDASLIRYFTIFRKVLSGHSSGTITRLSVPRLFRPRIICLSCGVVHCSCRKTCKRVSYLSQYLNVSIHRSLCFLPFVSFSKKWARHVFQNLQSRLAGEPPSDAITNFENKCRLSSLVWRLICCLFASFSFRIRCGALSTCATEIGRENALRLLRRTLSLPMPPLSRLSL